MAYYAAMRGATGKDGHARKKGGRRRKESFLRRKLGRKRHLATLLVLGGLTAYLLLVAVFGEQGLLKVRQLRRERIELEERVAALQAETAELRSDVRGMQSDPFLYEKAAREQLGLVKPGEVVYDFRPDPLERSP